MTDRPTVFVHVGVPKSGTTFLQRAMARKRAALRRDGFLYPGPRVDHFFPALDLMSWDYKGHEDPRRHNAWPRLVARLREWGDTALISHEVLAAASDADVARLLADLDFAEVHIVLTLRDPARQLVAVWQENIKNRATRPFDAFFRRTVREAHDPSTSSTGYWPYQDVAGILHRWHVHLPPERIHVVVVPPADSHDTLWDRWLRALDLPPTDPPLVSANTSLGLAETELLRRLNSTLDASVSWPQYERVVKFQLANEVLSSVPDSVPLALSAREHEWCVAQAQAQRDAVLKHAGHVQGDLADLQPRPWEPSAALELRNDLDTERVLTAALHALAGLVRLSEPPASPPTPGPPIQLSSRVRHRLAALVRRR